MDVNNIVYFTLMIELFQYCFLHLNINKPAKTNQVFTGLLDLINYLECDELIICLVQFLFLNHRLIPFCSRCTHNDDLFQRIMLVIAHIAFDTLVE